LTSFECFASPLSRAERRPVLIPDHASLQALTVPLVLWFAQHHQAMHTTRIDFHLREPGQFWFIVRHGDTARWTRKIRDEETEFIRFTVEQEEAIFYDPEEDELWVSAQTEDERELFRRQFGLSLRGSTEYFSLQRNFTVDPLRTDGADSLNVAAIAEIRKIVLRQIQVRWEGGLHELRTDSPEDLFASMTTAKVPNVSPLTSAGTLTKAAFLVEFTDSQCTREIEICPPHEINLQRSSDLGAVARWLSKSAFRLDADHISEVRRAAS
jgi:hypothetical protein